MSKAGMVNIVRIPDQRWCIRIMNISFGKDLITIARWIKEVNRSTALHSMAIGGNIHRNTVFTDQIRRFVKVAYRFQQE